MEKKIIKKEKNFLDKQQIAAAMCKHINITVNPELVVEVPSDGTTSHMGVGPWKVWAARTGEFTLIAHDTGDGNPGIIMV